MQNNGFQMNMGYGTLDEGFELSFTYIPFDIQLDMFWVYEGMYWGGKYMYVSSYNGSCGHHPKKMCVWVYRPYTPVKLWFAGDLYFSMPISALEDGYGHNWRTPKQFEYHEGLVSGYTNLAKDFFQKDK